MTTNLSSRSASRRSVVGGLAGVGLSSVLAAIGHRAAALGASPTAAADVVTIERNIGYSDDDPESQVLDVYRSPAHGAPRPAVVLLHGGAWTYGLGGRDDLAPAAQALATAGYVAFNVEYRRTGRPSGGYVWPAQLDDVQRAVRWVRANAGQSNVDPDRFCAYGHSAGGHLASMLGLRETRDNSDAALAEYSSKVSCVVAMAAQFDLKLPYPQAFDRNAVISLLGGTEDSVPDAYRDASPVTWVDADSAPFLIIHGGADRGILPVQARSMVDLLHDAAVDVIHAELAFGDHFSVAAWSTAGAWALTFMDDYLRPGE